MILTLIHVLLVILAFLAIGYAVQQLMPESSLKNVVLVFLAVILVLLIVYLLVPLGTSRPLSLR